MRRFTSITPALVVVVVTLAVLAATPALVKRVSYARTDARIQLARQTIASDDILERIDKAVTAISDAVLPGVVHIDASTRGGRGRGPGELATGAGWVLDDRGHIVTNAHVVRGVDRIFVQFADGRTAEGEILGIDSLTDIAVVKVKAAFALHPLVRASGQRIEQGQRVYAFGSPFGFRFSMSEGIISGLGRNPAGAVIGQGYTNFIQTDAAVNPGNSGGPLVNARGEVVGMSVAIATGRDTTGTTEGQSAGIGFAIPLGTIESVVTQLVESGEVTRGFLGISISRARSVPVSRGDEYLGLGMSVPGVERGGPADRAGLEFGDVILAIDDEPTPNEDVLRSLISLARPGQTVALRVWRNDELVELHATLEALEPLAIEAGSIGDALQRFGVYYSGSRRAPQLFVHPDSAAERAGLRSGMSIVAVDGQAVSDLTQQFQALARAGFLDGRSVPIIIRTGDADEAHTQELTIRLQR